MTTFSSEIIGGALGKYFVGSTWSCVSGYDSLVWDTEIPNPKPTHKAFDDCCTRYIEFVQVQWELYGYRLRREQAYDLRGSTISNLTVAMLESLDGTDPQKLIDLQVIRAQVKLDFPKPQTE